MKHVPRALEPQLLKAAKAFPALVLTGPRRAGKTWLLRHLFPNASYHPVRCLKASSPRKSPSRKRTAVAGESFTISGTN